MPYANRESISIGFKRLILVHTGDTKRITALLIGIAIGSSKIRFIVKCCD
jgi:hypothetical protein